VLSTSGVSSSLQFNEEFVDRVKLHQDNVTGKAKKVFAGSYTFYALLEE